MPYKLSILLIICSWLVCSSLSERIIESDPIKIEWVRNLNGDFGFHHEWSYPENVFLNDFGQLSCDGLCPAEIASMIDTTGRIIEDSLAAFYNLIDTTHQMHSLESEAWCYEYAGTNFMHFWRTNDKEIIGKSQCNAATHSLLELKINGNFCRPSIYLNSISRGFNYHFLCSEGTIQIDPFYFKKGVIKATFDFKFANPLNPSDHLYWKGKIFSIITRDV